MKRRSGSEPMTRIQDLSEDALDNILSRNRSEHVSLVCRKWYESDRASRRELELWFGNRSGVPPKRFLVALVSRFCNVTSLTIGYSGEEQMDEQVDDECLRCVSAECVKLTELYLQSYERLTDVGIANVALCPGLTTVHLERMRGVSETGLLSLLRRCRSLKDLFIYHLKNVRGVEWLEFLGTHCQVESLGISNCNGVKESQLIRLGRRGWDNLRKFQYNRLSRNILVPVPQSRAWTFFGPEDTQHCRNLEELKLSYCVSKSRTGVLSILGQCTKLRDMTINHCVGFVDQDMYILARNNPNVSSLTLEIDDNVIIDNVLMEQPVTNVSLVHITENLHWLKSLFFTFVSGAQMGLESGLLAIVERCA